MSLVTEFTFDVIEILHSISHAYTLGRIPPLQAISSDIKHRVPSSSIPGIDVFIMISMNNVESFHVTEYSRLVTELSSTFATHHNDWRR
jgi:hypothetical protein